MKKKIVFVISAMTRGGAERVVSILANHYAEKEFDVSIVLLWHSTVEYELDSSVRIVNLSNDKIKPLIRIPSLTRRLRRYIKSLNSDAVVSFIAQNNLITYWASRGVNTRFIPSERIDPSAMKRNTLFEKLLAKAYAKSAVTVLQTERAKRYFPKAVQSNSIIIGNPISVKCEALGIRKNKIVTAGRLTAQKNHKMLIEAFCEVHKNHPEYTLEIYGEGPLRAELEALVRDKGLDGAIFLPGNVPNLHERISDAKMFVLSSDYEGLSNALLEAMMMGLPCVSTDCSGSDEVIENGKNGLLIPVGDKEKLVEALTTLVENHEYRECLGARAKASVEKYKVENVIKQWTDVIEKVE